MPCRTWFCTLWRTTSRLTAVNPKVISTIESRKRVRNRVRGTSVPGKYSGNVFETDSDEAATGFNKRTLANDISEQTCSPFHARFGSVPDWRDRVPIFGAA